MQLIKIEFLPDSNQYVATIANAETNIARILSREEVLQLREIEQSALVNTRDSITNVVDHNLPSIATPIV
jgi:hypothetical protein